MRSLALLLALAPSVAFAEDVTEQHITVDLTGPELVVEFEATLELTSATDRISMLRPILPVVSATLDDRPVTFRPSALAPEVLDEGRVDASVGPGEAVLRVRLAGTPLCTQPSGAAQCWHDATQTILTPSWVGTAWYYVDPFDTGLFVGSLAVITPADRDVLGGQGPAQGIETLAGGALRHVFEIAIPTALVSVYVGALERIASTGPFPVIAHRTSGAPREVVVDAIERASRAVPALESFLGPYPVPEAHLVIAPRNAAFGGMGMLGTVFISEVIFGSFAFILDAGVIHELAHAYWAHLASGYDDAAPFFSEAMAEYSAWRAIGILEGDERRVSGVRMNSVWYMYARPDDADAPIVGPTTGRSPAYVHVTYHKGSSVLRMLEHEVGDEAFDDVLAALQAAGPGALDVAALRDALRAAGHPAPHRLDAWLSRTGFPRITAKNEDGRLELRVDGDWSLDLPVAITAFDGARSEVALPLRAGVNAFDVGAVAQIALDPEWTHVREVRTPDDVTLDGVVDAADLLAVALRVGTAIPAQRREDGGYDPLHDLDRDGRVTAADLARITP